MMGLQDTAFRAEGLFCRVVVSVPRSFMDESMAEICWALREESMVRPAREASAASGERGARAVVEAWIVWMTGAARPVVARTARVRRSFMMGGRDG
jgi:hypothetical protein